MDHLQEGKAFLPQWMMNQLAFGEGQFLQVCGTITILERLFLFSTRFSLFQVESITLPKASYAKLKPQSVDFLSISNPRAVLEVELRKFACLSKNDRIAVRYNDQTLEFLVLEIKPSEYYVF